MPLNWIEGSISHGDRVAVRDGDDHTYADLHAASGRGAARLLGDRDDLAGARIAFLVEPSFAWVATQWAIWRAGGIAVPLPISHPAAELAHVIDDCGVAAIVCGERNRDRVEANASARDIPVTAVHDLFAGGSPTRALPDVEPDRPAMLLYTSGSTGKPKGVLSTHGNVQAQVQTLVAAWQWAPTDSILGVLPLHHVHGIINVVSCALHAGARVELLPRFDAATVWDGFERHTLFMAVPTMYGRLIAHWEASPEHQERWSDAARQLRLMVSGSAALSVRTLERWKEITGHVLLERYGMTEIGMALSNTLEDRRAGFVGRPLPGVEARLVGDDGAVVSAGGPGEIHVRGPQVFREYWNRPEATKDAFSDGWFRTGDVAVVEDGVWRILGRSSVDIIKSGGYKVSALEIEDVLRGHAAIAECAVVGVDDEEWGERVCVAVVLGAGHRLELDGLRAWARERLAPYKIPSRLVEVDALPRNALGKVVKPEVRTLFA